MRRALQIQKAPLIFIGRKFLEMRRPAENENDILRKPPMKLWSARVQPTPMFQQPEPLNIANAAREAPQTPTKTFSHLSDNRCRKIAYIMLPIYSKKRDQDGPLRGNISPFPLISGAVPGMAGSIRIASRKERMTEVKGTAFPSHWTLP